MTAVGIFAALSFALSGRGACAAEASTAPVRVDLGIPTSVPWQDSKGRRAAQNDEGANRAAAEGFWQMLPADLAALDGSRDGLKAALGFARSHPEVFPPRPGARAGAFFDEYAELAAGVWFFFADHYLALESLVGSYGEFSSLPEGRERSAAFSAACAARLAQRRFLAEWAALASKDPAVDKALEAAEESGFPPALYAHLKRLSSAGRADAAALAAYAAHTGAFGSLDGVLRSRKADWESRRREDIQKLGMRTGRGSAQAGRARQALRVELPLLSRPGRWRGAAPAEPQPPSEESEAFLARETGTDWMDLPVSSQIVVAVQAIKSCLSPDPPQGPRPDSLIALKQLEAIRWSLEPGDILLLRRERFLDEVGLGGFWRDAAVYAGTPRAGKKKGGPPEFFVPDAGRAALKPLPNAAAGDSLAVLRPRVAKQAREEAVRGLFALLGKPLGAGQLDDAQGIPGASGALLAAAYPKGLRWPLRNVLGRAALPVNALARDFDAEFGTQKQQFDLVVFIDASEKWQKAGTSTLEEFRPSWRRAAWTPKPQPEEKKDSGGSP